MFAAVVAAYLVGNMQGLPTPEVAALAFTALVAGNVGLILLYRPGRTFLDALRRPNPAFAWVSVLALATVLVATQWAPAAAWFAFAPPPPVGSLAALLLPFAAAALMWRWRRP
jgi:Ca2+-transporting ATPase